jgi:tetratricopeptide (TPR) repeat protein
MAIQGSLREASLADVLQLLYLGRRTGRLALADRQRHAAIWLEEGWIVHASVVNRRDRLGEVLVKSGPVSQAQLEEALAIQAASPGRRVGEILFSLGAVSAAELKRFIRRHVEEALYALFNWSSGVFTFEAGVLPEPEDRVERLSPESILLEGARRVDEWSLIEKKIPSFDLVFARDDSVGRGPELAFTEAQRLILPLLDGARDLRQVIDQAALSDFTAGQAVFGLLTAGVIRLTGSRTPAEPARMQETQIAEHRNLGIAFYRTGMLDEAEREFRQVRELRPSEGGAPFCLALVALRRERWEEALTLLREASDRGGPRAAILHNLAVAHEHLGRYPEAEAAWSEAARRAPEDSRILLGWAILALRQQDYETARRRLQQARDLSGDRIPALWYWAAALAEAAGEQFEAALEVARGGVQAYPADAALRNNLAVLLELTGDLVDAERLLRGLLEEDATLPQVSKNLGDICYRSGRFEQATEYYQRAIRLAPDLGDDVYFRLGNLAFRRRDMSQARAHWDRTVQLNPAHQLARANLDTLPGAG